MRTRLTDRFVKSIKAEGRKSPIFMDDKVIGFGVQVRQTGRKSFTLDHTFEGRRRRYFSGDFPDWSTFAAREQGNVCLTYPGKECPGRRRLGRSALQLNRKTARAAAAAVGYFWKGRATGANSRKDQSGNACGDERHDSVAREPLHEQVPSIGLIDYNGHLEVHTSLLAYF